MSAPDPILLIVLDGLADWPSPSLAGLTPLEAASTPNLDLFAAESATGLDYPLAPGRAPSSELALWAMLGYPDHAFPGRAVLEAEGHGVLVEDGIVASYGALRSAEVVGGELRLRGWYREAEDGECRPLTAAIDGLAAEGITFEVSYLERGDFVVFLRGAQSAGVSDSDPFSTTEPVLAVESRDDAANGSEAARTAAAVNQFLLSSHRTLQRHPINAARVLRGALPLNTVVTKWTGQARRAVPLPLQVGGGAAIVASAPMYAGLASRLGAGFVGVTENQGNPEAEIAAKMEAARELLASGAALVLLHTKLPDVAAHLGDPAAKRDVITDLDRGLAGLHARGFLPAGTVVGVTCDHTTPSWPGVVHSGDAVPLAIRSERARVDAQRTLSERPLAAGSLGTVRGADVLALLVNLAGRARFQGSRHGARQSLARQSGLRRLSVADA